MKIKFEINVHFKNPLEVLVGRLRRPHLNFQIGPAEEQDIEEGPKMFSTTITDSQLRRIVVSPMGTDKKGNPAPLDGPPTFASSDEAIVTFAADPADATGFTGILSAVGPLGSAVAVSITADGKLGPDVFPIVENGLVEITAGDATSLAVTVGDPEEQP